jgi:hypothetical protein
LSIVLSIQAPLGPTTTTTWADGHKTVIMRNGDDRAPSNPALFGGSGTSSDPEASPHAAWGDPNVGGGLNGALGEAGGGGSKGDAAGLGSG